MICAKAFQGDFGTEVSMLAKTTVLRVVWQGVSL